jgi:hypothetical protein
MPAIVKKDPMAALVLTLGKGKPKGEPDGDESAEVLAAEGLISAVKAGDAKEVVSAYKTLRDACSYEEPDAD